MKISVKDIFFHLILVQIIIYNIKCEISESLYTSKSDDTYSIDEYNVANLINEKQSHITNTNLVNQNERLNNSYKGLLNNQLDSLGKRHVLQHSPGNNNNNNISVLEKLNKDNSLIKHTKRGAYFIHIKQHNIINKNETKLNTNTNNAQFTNTKKSIISSHDHLDKYNKTYIDNLKSVKNNFIVPILDDNNTDFDDNNYLESEKYIPIKYPFDGHEMKHNNSNVDGNNIYHNEGTNKKSDVTEKENYNGNIKPTTCTKNKKESINKTLDTGNEFDLRNALLDDYKPDVNNYTNIKKSFKNKKKQRVTEKFKDFDLADALTPNINEHISINDGERNNENANFISMKDWGTNDEISQKGTLYKEDVDMSLKYLGLGYDIIMGNPEGDPLLSVDPGFRAPVLQINIKDVGISNNNDNIELNEGNQDSHSNIDDIKDGDNKKNRSNKKKIIPWIIPEHSCNQSKNVEEIKSLEEYTLELLSDVKVSTPSIFPYSFSASAGYKNALKKFKIQNSIIFMMKIYCLRYYTGIPTTTTMWEFTHNFRNALNKLPHTFDGLKEDNECTYEYYISKSHSPQCEKNVNKWMTFFKLHGTHVAHEMYLGGKIIIKVNIEKEEYNKIKENNLNMKTIFDFYFHKMGLSVRKNKQVQKFINKIHGSKTVSILGGHPGLNIDDSSFFEKWINSIDKNSMPIRTKLLPFSFFMDDPNMIKAYSDALIFYGLTYGIQIFDKKQYNHNEISIGDYLEKSIQKIYHGAPPGLLICPIGSTILMGFSLNLDFYKNQSLNEIVGINTCEQMKESCSGNGFTNKYSDIRIWGLCSEKPLYFIKQVVEQNEATKTTATCPENSVILFGFALMKGTGRSSANVVDLYPCRTGQNSCSAVLQNQKFKQSMIYIACVDKTTIGLDNLQTFTKVKNLGYVDPNNYQNDGYLDFECPQNSTLVFGFALEFHTNFQKARNNFIKCSKEENTCSIKGVGINTNLYLFKKDKHSLGIVALCRSAASKMGQN
ncbi:perforin-like protein 2 [Plasmodium berghei]|uniref:Perforin-like protein 2 n=2 Tax=Plasmodium berghei TaxID=5821 RepID=A0A509AS12_PLABA|nr:perforin-like protein 2 [Plasmodium berghei ANKA]SCM26527.1 perforin-like protein 2 [Plasmodium berghei]SCN28503.1 perforin-like protein 2 [Plasmodium berghei]SCO64254.1 perforin-like protein 2 [Plasmodium berghei]VUC58386.1 perforin-like protein 2 [Plasmodium berghei ANKA]|eukprot:XP_034424149.1 perforin-like protein 2 [Plasmodium berghei ANKA]